MKRNSLLLALLITANSLLAQIQHTIGNVYDFEINDLFQYSYVLPNQGYGSQKNILDKYYSINKDTITYIIENSTWSANPYTQTTTYNQNIDTISYTNLNSLVFQIGTVSFENSNCIDSNKVFTQIISPYFEPEITIRKFGIGLGQIETEYIYAAENKYYKTSLSYYNKGGVSCGNFSSAFGSIGTKKIDSNNLTISVFPNPTNDFVTISANQDLIKIELFNEIGQMIKSDYKSKAMDLSDLPKGLYIVKLYGQQNIVIKKIIKK